MDAQTATTTEDQVAAWRHQQAQQLGYEHVDCEHIAYSTVDLHQLAALIAAGCTRRLALDILT